MQSGGIAGLTVIEYGCLHVTLVTHAPMKRFKIEVRNYEPAGGAFWSCCGGSLSGEPDDERTNVDALAPAGCAGRFPRFASRSQRKKLTAVTIVTRSWMALPSGAPNCRSSFRSTGVGMIRSGNRPPSTVGGSREVLRLNADHQPLPRRFTPRAFHP